MSGTTIGLLGIALLFALMVFRTPVAFAMLLAGFFGMWALEGFRTAGALILTEEGNEVGRITSGGFSPSLQRPIAMGYVATPLAEVGTALKLEQRGKLFEARVAPMPFVPHRYHRKGAA